MNVRTSYLVGLLAAFFVLSSQFVSLPVNGQNLKVVGPEGQSRVSSSSDANTPLDAQIRQYGPTTTKDTFWGIAQRVRPDESVSIYQVMAAIYEANPQAFTSDNYNSLERGMVLLIPSKEVMLAIPKSLAQQRAEQDDERWSKGDISAKPRTNPTPATKAAEVVQSSNKPAAKPVIVAVDASAETKTAATNTKPSAPSTDLPKPTVTAKPKLKATVPNEALNVDNLQTANLNLTDELARSQDQLQNATSENDQLKAQIEELKQRVTVLEESLKAARMQVEQLQSDLESGKSATAAELVAPAAEAANANDAPVSETDAATQPSDETSASQPAAEAIEPGDQWRNLMSNPLLLTAAAVVPSALLLLLGGWLLKRRKSAPVATAATTSTTAALAAEDDHLDDELLEGDDAAIRLDSDDEPHVDQLLDLDHPLAPEAQLPLDSSADMSMQEMFVDDGASHEEPVFSADDAQSLDDLWAEAMGEDATPATTAKVDDFDSLLDGLDNNNSADAVKTDTAQESMSLPDDVAAVFEQDFGAPVAEVTSAPEVIPAPEATSLAEPAVATVPLRQETQKEVTEAAEAAVDDELAQMIAAELELGVTAEDTNADPDALLAELAQTADVPARSEEEVALQNAIAAELDPEVAVDADAADADALLAALTPTAAPAADELDQLLAELTPDADGALTPASSVTSAEEDLDALLAELAPQELPTSDRTAAVEKTASVEQSVPSEPTVPAETIVPAAKAGTAPVPAIKPDTAADELDALLAELTPDISPSVSAADNVLAADATHNTLDDDLDGLLAELTAAEKLKPDSISPEKATPAAKLGGVFDDLKAPAPSFSAAQPPLSATDPLSDEELLRSFANDGPELDALEYELSPEDDIQLDPKLTVDEALAALDAEASKPMRAVSDEELTTFQEENGYIDIDKLLNDADESAPETDPYKMLDVDMGDLDGLMDDADMVDVDDAENSVNAKLDLARAYIEIDDKDSAKALLKEVQLEGNPRQQDEAQTLLKDI